MRGTRLTLFHGQPEGGATARGAIEGEARPSAPRAALLGTPSPSLGVQLQLPARRVLCQPRRVPASRPQKAAPQYRQSLLVPFSPKVRGSLTPTGPQARRGAGFCRDCASQSRTARRARGRLAREGGSGSWSLGTDARARPDLSVYLARPGLSGDVWSTLLQGGRPAHIAASPTGRPESRWVPSSPLTAWPPPPHPPTPSVKSVTAFLPPDLLQSLRAVTRSWAQRRGADQRCLAPPSRGPRRRARPERTATSSWSPSPERSAAPSAARPLRLGSSEWLPPACAAGPHSPAHEYSDRG